MLIPLPPPYDDAGTTMAHQLRKSPRDETMAGWTCAVSDISGCDDACIGAESASREIREEIEDGSPSAGGAVYLLKQHSGIVDCDAGLARGFLLLRTKPS